MVILYIIRADQKLEQQSCHCHTKSVMSLSKVNNVTVQKWKHVIYSIHVQDLTKRKQQYIYDKIIPEPTNYMKSQSDIGNTQM